MKDIRIVYFIGKACEEVLDSLHLLSTSCRQSLLPPHEIVPTALIPAASR